MEVALSRCWHLTDNTAVIRALDLTGKDILMTKLFTRKQEMALYSYEVVNIQQYPPTKLAG